MGFFVLSLFYLIFIGNNNVTNKMKETPSQLNLQSYLLNFPSTLSTNSPNNIYMLEMTEDELVVNKPKLYKQWMDLYSFMAANSLVYVLPSEGNFQDLTYVANLGIHLHHLNNNSIVLSNFTSPPRQGEEKVGEAFFKQMGYNTHISPYKFEGEADLKFLHDNVYIGGYGIRSDIKTYKWMEEKFDMHIVKVLMEDDWLYHLDCSIFPMDKENTLISCDQFYPDDIEAIEKVTNIIDVPEELHYYDITNNVRLGNMLLANTFINELDKNHEWYHGEKMKIEFLEKVCSDLGLEPVFFNLSEFAKSGAALSCLVMHLNTVDFNKQLL